MKIPTYHGSYDLASDSIRALQIRFPLANVERELTLACYWLEKNPASRPKKPLRFLENWMKKCSPRAPIVDMKRVKWWESESGTLEMQKQLDLPGKKGESWAELRNRIAMALDQRRSA
jgi:hypothetical protein